MVSVSDNVQAICVIDTPALFILKPQSEAVGTQFFRIFRTPPERYTNTTYISDVSEGRELEKKQTISYRQYTDSSSVLVFPGENFIDN